MKKIRKNILKLALDSDARSCHVMNNLFRFLAVFSRAVFQVA